MDNIHDLDNDQIVNIKNMLNSWDVDNIRMALILLNNANFNNKEITNQINYLMNECTGLRFAVYNNTIDGGIRARFHFEDRKIDASNFKEVSLFVDDESTSESERYMPVPYPLSKIKFN